MNSIAIINGDVWTMESEGSKAQAVLIQDNKIIAVGKNEEILAACSEKKITVIDADGNTVLPGFIDSHMHLGWYIETFLHVDCRYPIVKTMDEMIHCLKGNLSSSHSWLKGYGYDENKLLENRHPETKDLDKVSSELPVVLYHISGHIITVNSKVLEICGINENTKDPHDGKIVRDDSGHPTGVLLEGAQNIVFSKMPSLSLDELSNGLDKAVNKLLSMGITSLHDMATEEFNKEITCYYEKLVNGKLSMRINFYFPFPTYTDFKKHMALSDSFLKMASLKKNLLLKIGGVKFFADGSLIGKTAAMYTPYKKSAENYGILRIEEEELLDDIKLAYEHELQVAIHAIGEKTVDFCLSAYSKILEKDNNLRCRIEHCGLINASSLRCLKEYNIYVSSQPKFIEDFGDGFVECLEESEYQKVYAFQSMLNSGIHLGFSSDSAVTEIDPIPAMRSAVNRETESGNIFGAQEKISLYNAVENYTVEGAYGSFEENVKGKIVPGFLADLVILSDILDEETLIDIKVEKTLFDGKIIYENK